MVLLIQNDKLTFSLLKKMLDISDGNLSTHLKRLKKDNFINIEKYFENNRPKTEISISVDGEKAFKEYIEELNKFIREI